MKLLLLTPQLPYPPRQGTAIRNFNLIDQLARRHTVDLLTFLAPDEILTADNPLHELCRRVGALPQPQRSTGARLRDTLQSRRPDMALRLASPQMSALVRDFAQSDNYAIVQAEGIEMGHYGLVAAADGRSSFIFDDHNCEYVMQRRNALTDLRSPVRWPAAAYSLIQWQKLRHYEAWLCNRAAAVAAVSEADAQALRAIAPRATIRVVSNGIDLDYYTPEEAQPTPYPTLVFTGKMDYRPNIDAVLWFAQEVLPIIRRHVANAHFLVVGRNPHARLNALRTEPGITLTGAVTDVRPLIRDSAVYVIPLRVGGGTRFKALEAMASGRPIVSTSLGVEGLGVRNGSEMLLADGPTAFAQAVLTLLAPENNALRAHLALNARRFVEENSGWPPIVRGLEDLYTEVYSDPTR
jgi:sugar transferase (PEP-CTERM/EpsH1 system associated)